MFIRFAPAIFVLIWSTGWIVSGYVAPYAEPLTFLCVRFIAAAIVMALIARFMGATWPKTRTANLHAIISGTLLHGVYLGGVWWAIAKGLPVGISGLIAAIQPLTTALIARHGAIEFLSRRQWSGIILGLLGLIVALFPEFSALELSEIGAYTWLIVINVIAMIAVAYGSVYQKRHLQSGDLVPISALQYIGGLLIVLPTALIFETLSINWNIHSVFGLAWSVLGLSAGADLLYLYLIRLGEVSRAASLIYLIPPTVAIEAWILYGETLNALQIIGTVIVVAGVYLVARAPKAASQKTT